MNWPQFLAAYNPRKDYHILGGSSASPTAFNGSDSALPLTSSNPAFPTVAGGGNGASDDSSLALEDNSVVVSDDILAQQRQLSRVQTAPALSSSYTRAGSDRVHQEIRKVWQNALRECQRQDVDRCGLVSRSAFITALEKAHLGKVQITFALLKSAIRILYIII